MSAIRIALNVGSLVLIAVLGWLIVRIVLGITQPESLYAPAPIVPPAQLAVSGGQVSSYDFSSDPFSFGEVAAIDPADFFEDVPETTLDLKLIGIVSESSATFRMSDGKDKAVGVGEEVMNNVVLQQTKKDFVMLDVNGDSQKLTREIIKVNEKNNVQKIAVAAPAGTLPSRESVEDIFSKVTIKPSRNPSTGKVQGFQITAKRGADLSQFKLKSGDILTRVGPMLLDTQTPDVLAARELLTSGAAQDVEVIRDGSPVTIRIGQ
jgi:hypothetical protein